MDQHVRAHNDAAQTNPAFNQVNQNQVSYSPFSPAYVLYYYVILGWLYATGIGRPRGGSASASALFRTGAARRPRLPRCSRAVGHYLT